MSNKIDQIDRKILQRLQIDATIGVDALAEQVNLSRNACWRRVKALEANGTIQSRVALLNPTSLGIGLQVFVLIRSSEHNPQWVQKFRTVVRETPEIVSAHRMSGDLDYVLRVRVANVADYDRFYQSLIKQIDLSDISASFVMEDLKDTTALPL
jgi:Lrp/AsnC family transcriptional regulator